MMCCSSTRAPAARVLPSPTPPPAGQATHRARAPPGPSGEPPRTGAPPPPPPPSPRLVLPGRRAPPGSAGGAGRGRYRSGPQNPVTDPQPRRPLGVSPPARNRLSLPGARQGPARPDPCLPRGRRGRSSPTPSAAYIAAAAVCVLRLGFVLEVTTVVASPDLQSVSHLLVLLQIGKEQERRR